MSLLEGKRILTAGGTGTVGTFLVTAQLEAGATVIVPSRSDRKVEQLRASVGAELGRRLVTVAGDITDPADVQGILDVAGTLDGAVASLGRWASASSVFGASSEQIAQAFSNYVPPHLLAAQAILPALEERGSAYVMINGSLAFEAEGGATGLVSIATAALSMLARVLMKERGESRARINELVIYANLREDEEAGRKVGREVCRILGDDAISGETIHLR